MPETKAIIRELATAFGTMIKQNNNIEEKLRSFEVISLAEMKNHNLQRRIDSKYIFPYAELYNALELLEDEFYVLEVANKRLQTYNNLYFDTVDFGFYTKHHNGHKNRYKVRKRQYQDSDTSFLEVKFKSNKSVTQKTRISLPNKRDKVVDFIAENLPKEYKKLVPSLKNQYKRIALISKRDILRLTLDIDLNYANAKGENISRIDGLVIAELKRASHVKSESFDKLLSKYGLRPSSFSKYCIGCSISHAEIKSNRFKPILSQIRRLN